MFFLAHGRTRVIALFVVLLWRFLADTPPSKSRRDSQACSPLGTVFRNVQLDGAAKQPPPRPYTAASNHTVIVPELRAGEQQRGWRDCLVWRAARLPTRGTAPAGHGGFGPPAHAYKGSGSGRHAGATSWHGVACCSPIDSGSARRRRDTAVSGRKRRLTSAVAVVGTLTRLPGMVWRAARL